MYLHANTLSESHLFGRDLTSDIENLAKSQDFE